MTSLAYFDLDVCSFSKIKIRVLLLVHIFTTILNKHIDFTNVFLLKFAIKLQKHKKINDYAIKLIYNQLSIYKLIYSLCSIK